MKGNLTLNNNMEQKNESIQFVLGATKHLYNWLCPLVGRTVGRLVCWSHFTFLCFLFFDRIAPAQMLW